VAKAKATVKGLENLGKLLGGTDAVADQPAPEFEQRLQQPPDFNYLRDYSEAYSAAQSFARRRADKAGYWQRMRDELVGFADALPKNSPF